MASELRKKTQEAIDTVRETFGGCELAMLIDCETSLVLVKSSQSSVPQDQLDRLAVSAQSDLEGNLATALTNSANEGDILSAVNVEKDKIVAMLRLQGSDDALVCQFANLPNRTDLQDAAKQIFDLSIEGEAA